MFGFKTAQKVMFNGVGVMLLAFSAQQAHAQWTPSLTISGTPKTSVTAGIAYSFTPNADSRYDRVLTFSVYNKPAWAYFSRSTGRLSGTPQLSHVGTYSNITISVSDGRRTVSLPAFTVKVNTPVTTPPTPVNAVPVISGTATAQVMSGAAYSFKPTATDANGDALTFSVTNLPTWATFNAATGLMSGTPSAANAGTYSNIVISVSDGKGGSASLAGFSVAVVVSTNGTALVSWTPPTQNTDGTAIVNLASYKVSYGTTRGGPYSTSATVANPSISSFQVDNLVAGNTYYFVVTARNAAGIESAVSNEASKTFN